MKRPLAQPHLMIVIHSLGGGGAERVAADMAGYWIQQGIKVTLVTQTDPSTDVYALHPRVTRRVMGTASASRSRTGGILSNAWRIARLRRLIKQDRPTLIVGMMTTSSILCLLAARGLRCRVIATEHTHPPSQSLSPAWERLRRWTYPKAHCVVSLTPDTEAWIDRHIPGCKLAVIPNAVRWPMAATDPVVEPPERNGRLRLLAVGRLHPQKGFDLLVQAFAEIAPYLPLWDLVILGEGDERTTLQERIDQLGLTERVKMPGRVGNVGDWYQASDLYVLSSRVEGLSNTLLEAMASGLPAVAFDCETGPRAIIRDGIDGVLVRPVEDAEILAAHLSHIMAHPEKRTLMARRATDVRDRFSMPRVMAMWAHVFGLEHRTHER